jgi:hypothetical protein
MKKSRNTNRPSGRFFKKRLTAFRGGFSFSGFYKLDQLFNQFIFFVSLATFAWSKSNP